MNTSFPFPNVKTHLLSGVLTFLFIVLSLQVHAIVRYVKPTASGTGDGSSWTNASGNLQAMINASGSGDEVWVAAGTYKPTTTTNRNISFSMKNGVAIYGGFNGTETQLSQRNWRTNVTTLSGDIGISGNNSDNSYSVIVNEGINSAIFDGFTVTQANSTPPTGNLLGGGIYNAGSSPIIRNCIFSNNTGSYANAGIFNFNDGTPTITNCLFINNIGTVYSSGVYNFDGSANIINCTFYGNYTAITNQGGNLVSVSNCILWGNYNQFFLLGLLPTALTVANSIVQGGWSGTGNLDTDPLFVNAAGSDFRLQACSPAINAGGNGYVPGGVTTDLDVNARFYNNATVDIGAYEFQSTPPAFVTCYRDNDNDSFGNPAMSQVFCNTCGTGYVPNGADCNDANQAINPFAAEVCDGFDNNCNSQTDEGNVCCPPGNVIYVKANATGANNGTSWINAYTSLQSALNNNCAGITEIWVAAGTYKPTTGTDRNISFVMKNGVAIYGGFNGTETQLSQRNWRTNITTLSGEIGTAGNADNTFRVINNNFNASAPLTSGAILDGFIVEAANANGSFPLNLGGGMWNAYASPTVRNCIFRNNTATSGAAIFNDNSQANVTNCLFTGNSCSVAGAAISNGGGTASATVTNCTFYGNTGGNSTISNEVGATAVSNCIVWGNANGVSGGTVSYSIVQGGFSGTGNLNADPLFVNAAGGDFHLQACSRAIDLGADAGAPSNDFDNNARVNALSGSNIVDAGIYEYQSIFANNRYYVNAAAAVSGHGSSWGCAIKNLQEALALASNGDEIWVAAGTYKPTTGTNRNISFVMKNGVAIYGGFNGTETQLSQRNWTANVTVLSGDIGEIGYPSDNSHHVILNKENGLNSTALLDGFTISGGDANSFYPNDRGGGMCNLASSPAVANCIFTDNWAISGGGMHNEDFSSPVVTNCRFFDNAAGSAGGGIYNRLGSFPNFINCTISGNIPTEVVYWAGFPTFINCIIWGNHNLTGGNSSVTYSIIQGGHPGTGNLNANPLFVNATGGDLRLQACSPAVNTGSNAAVPEGITTDLDKNPRTFGGTVDMGAYEYQTAPTPIVPVCQNQTVLLNDMGMATFSAALLNNGSTGCGTLMYAVGGQSTLNFTCANTGAPIPVTLTVTDDRGISATCPATITVIDNTPPTITCPATQTLVLGANCTATLPDYTGMATTGDNCGVQSVTQSPEAGTSASGAGNMPVTLTVTDVNGIETECTFTVTKVDQAPPTITCPTPQTLVLGANCTATLPNYTSLATTGDNCGVQSVTQSPTAGTPVSGAGNITVTLTVTDVNGLTNTCAFTVTKVDNTAPTISCPATQTLVLGANCTATLPNYTSLATTADNCGVQSVTQSPTTGTPVSGAGNMTVTMTVTDLNGNETECTFMVTKVDQTPPTITCPATQTLVLGANCTATLPNYTSLATTADNCGVQSVTQSPTAGTLVTNAGSLTVTLTVTDLNGNDTECTFMVTKVDQTPPTITCPTTQTLVLGANCTTTLPDYTGMATTGDNCGVQSVTQSPTAGTTVSGAGNLTVTLTVTDVNGNNTPCTFTVIKLDQTPPTITCPTTKTLVLGANCTTTLPDYTSLATTADNCGVQSVTQSPTAGTLVTNAGSLTVTLTVTDLNGNDTECTFMVTKVDQTPPTISCPTTQTLVLGANCTATLPDYTGMATTGDNCGIQSVTQLPEAGTSASGAGNMPVTLTVTDVNGIETECTFTVTKVDQTPPTPVCKNTTVFIGNTGTYTLQPADVFNATASSDNCSGVLTVTNISPAMVSCAQLNQTIPVTVTVQDGSGNTATCIAQINVQEGIALPTGWNNDNVGNANGTAGYKACSLNGSFTVAATGFSTSSADVLHFAHRQLCGNGEIIARVEADSGGGWAGVMLRESLLPGSKKVTLKTQLTNNIRREIRSVTNGGAAILNLTRPQHTWLRLVRNGSTFTGYTSTNGTNWSFAFSATISMTGCIYAGVFAESINVNTTTTATFSNISVTGASNSSLANGLPDTQVAAEEDEQVRIFPNPTTGEATIDLDIHAGKPGTIQVFNALGALTTQERLISGNPAITSNPIFERRSAGFREIPKRMVPILYKMATFVLQLHDDEYKTPAPSVSFMLLPARCAGARLLARCPLFRRRRWLAAPAG